MKHAITTVAPAMLALSLLAGAAFGQADKPFFNAHPQAIISAAELASAPAYENPLPAPDTSKVKAETASSLSASLAPGGAGGGARSSDAGSFAYGSFGIPYTSGRVQHGNTNRTSTNSTFAFLASTYPYRTIGKLTFTGGYCSASVIRRGVIVTAAHCIQTFGSGNTVFGNFQFTPGTDARSGATSAQIRPYGTWTWRTLVRPASWSNGTDIGSGSARDNDLAVIALNKDSSGRLIGQRTGALGYGWNNPSFVSSSKTGNLLVAATTTLGYPALMDSGRVMQRADGPSYLTTVGGAGQIWQGNNFTGGSSGGPWVINFVSYHPNLSGGATIGTFGSGRWVIGVTSWGSSDPNAPKDNYSSQFRQNTRYPNASYGVYGAGNIGSLLNTLCSAAANDGSGQTLGQRGWCS